MEGPGADAGKGGGVPNGGAIPADTPIALNQRAKEMGISFEVPRGRTGVTQTRAN